MLKEAGQNSGVQIRKTEHKEAERVHPSLRCSPENHIKKNKFKNFKMKKKEIEGRRFLDFPMIRNDRPDNDGNSGYMDAIKNLTDRVHGAERSRPASNTIDENRKLSLKGIDLQRKGKADFGLGDILFSDFVSPLMLLKGTPVNQVNYPVLFDKAYILNKMISDHLAQVGSINPKTISASIGTFIPDKYYGVAFSLSNINTLDGPQLVEFATAGLTFKARVENTSKTMQGILWFLRPEPVQNYDPIGGVSTALATDRYLVDEPIVNATVDGSNGSGVIGELTPVFLTASIASYVYRFITDVDYTWVDLNSDVLLSVTGAGTGSGK